ncbi:MAG: DoxX family protein [Opitutae bacterium]|nr:DoxX family protein [Opitutae bacterium]
MSATSSLVSKKARWAGYTLSSLSCLMMLFSAGIKLAHPPGIPEHFAELGWAMHHVPALGIIELACTIIYLIPRTSVLGAILLTGYLGGAAAAHVRIGQEAVVFQVGLGVALWAGLYLREPRLHALIPFRS